MKLITSLSHHLRCSSKGKHTTRKFCFRSSCCRLTGSETYKTVSRVSVNISPSHYRCEKTHHWRESTSSYAQESSTDTPTDILLGREVQDAFKVLMTRWLCNSHDVSHFAAFFIVIGAKTSVAESVWLLSFIFTPSTSEV